MTKKRERVTLYTLARQLGVSATTVSKALAGKKDIGVQTRDLVLKEAARLGYVPNRAAGALKTGRSMTVAAVFAKLDDMTNSISRGMGEGLQKEGYRLVLSCSHNYHHLEEEEVRHCTASQVDGLMVTSMLKGTTLEKVYAPLDFPVLFLGVEKKKGIPAGMGQVYVNECSAAAEAGAHLFKLGHKRVGLLMNRKYNQEKIRGVRKNQRAGFQTELFHIEDIKEQTLNTALRKHWNRKNTKRCTAIVCAGDMMAIKLIHLARAQGLDVPRDLSVVGFDDLPHSPYLSPSLSTVRVPLDALGKACAELWLDMRKVFPRTRKLKLERSLKCEYFPRESVGPAPL